MTRGVDPSDTRSPRARAGIDPDTGVDPRSRVWVLPDGDIALDWPRIMGILNVTPDSFWDGGRHTALDAALRQADRLVEEGADILDVGGESTRPGAEPVDPAEERSRVVPVIEAVTRRWPDLPVSVDTVKADVARSAIEGGATIVNDVSGGRLDPGILDVAAGAGAGLVLMHSRGTVDRMASYETAEYRADPIRAVIQELSDRREAALAAGVDAAAVVLDPGFGFSKRTAHSVAVLAGLERLVALGSPVLVGPSRKRFVGEALDPADRLPGTIAACVAALERGARLFRVHDVAPVRQALLLAESVLSAGADGEAGT